MGSKFEHEHLPVEVIVEQEMNRSNAWYLESIDGMTCVLSTQQNLQAVDSQEALQPLVLVVMTCDETNVAVTSLIATLLPCVSDLTYVSRLLKFLPVLLQCSLEVRALSHQTNRAKQGC
jgi:hypothetical protein